MAKSLQGVPFQIEYLHKSEDDDRRHKSRCIYIGPNGNCACKGRPCYGSAHCCEYSENIENLKEKYTVLYNYKKALAEKKAEKELKKESDAIIYETLLSLPLKAGFRFSMDRFLNRMRKISEGLSVYASCDKVIQACEKYNKESFGNIVILPFTDGRQFRCYKKNMDSEQKRCPYCNALIRTPKFERHINFRCPKSSLRKEKKEYPNICLTCKYNFDGICKATDEPVTYRVVCVFCD